MSTAIYEIYKCGVVGCGRIVPDPDTFCPRCAEEISSLNGSYFAGGPRDIMNVPPDLPAWVYRLGAVAVIALVFFIFWELAMGGR